jgi:hypothetical protein
MIPACGESGSCNRSTRSRAWAAELLEGGGARETDQWAWQGRGGPQTGERAGRSGGGGTEEVGREEEEKEGGRWRRQVGSTRQGEGAGRGLLGCGERRGGGPAGKRRSGPCELGRVGADYWASWAGLGFFLFFWFPFPFLFQTNSNLFEFINFEFKLLCTQPNKIYAPA